MTGYIIKLILCSGILLLAYILLFEKEKMHRFNRWYLRLSLAFPLLVPFISVEGQQEMIPFSEPVYIVISEGKSTASAAAPESVGDFIDPPILIYLIITAFLLSRFVVNLLALVKKIRTHEKLLYQDSILVLCNNHPVPHSFLHYIFVDKETYEKGNLEREILHHELAHARQKHSIDIIFAELLLCFTWFNPFMWMYKRAIQLNHEFLADNAVIKTFQDTASYQYLLLEKVSQSSHSMLTSSFNYLITKKRLIMMTKTSSPFIIAIKQMVLIPFSAVLVFLFSTKLVAQVVQEPAKKDAVPKQEQEIKKDTTRQVFWMGITIGYTKEGASPELMKEYQDIVNKYNISDSLTWQNFANITQEDRSRMETIFKQMSIEQQRVQVITFSKNPPPLAKVVPTQKQFEQYKKPDVYGVWIDDKRVSNSALNQYKNTDFSQVFVSKLYGPAKKGRNYTHQVNMMTNSYYADYRKDALKRSTRSVMMFMRRTEKSVGMRRID